MTQKDKEKITKFLRANLRTHTDWSGTYVEFQHKCDSVDKFIEIFFNSIEEK
jgi:hypothetical protein